MSKEIITIASNATLGKLHNSSREAKLEAQRILSYVVAGAEMSESFKRGTWDGRSSFFDYRSGTFPAGFVHFLAHGLRRAGFQTNCVARPFPEPKGQKRAKVDAFPEDPRYDYQHQVVEKLLTHGKIIARVATGGGKSRIAKLAFAAIRRPALFLTTRSILMYQMKDAVERDMGIEVAVLGDGQFGVVKTDANGDERRFIKMFNVGMVQTLVSRLALPCPDDSVEVQNKQMAIRKQTIDLLGKFELVIGEEAHEASGNSYYEILQHCTSAHYRLAMTATPFMKENEESNMRLMAAFGPIGIHVSEQTLIERGILAKPYFKYVDLTECPKHLSRGTGWQAAYRLGIVTHAQRNRIIVDEVKRASRYGLSSMVLVQQTKHGDLLRDLMTEAGLRVEFIRGENDQKGRKAALARLSNGEIDVLIGTTILDVGVDVPAVGLVILAGGGKAEIALRQRIGRGLRAKKNGPNMCFILDFSDAQNSYLKDHATQRLNVVRSTPGFVEGVLSGADFDYEGLGFEKLTSK
jgi:superfamily II DNA or RNA helicase